MWRLRARGLMVWRQPAAHWSAILPRGLVARFGGAASLGGLALAVENFDGRRVRVGAKLGLVDFNLFPKEARAAVETMKPVPARMGGAGLGVGLREPT